MDSRLREPERIYEWYVEISRPKDGEDGQITCVYPKDSEMEDDTKKQLPKFAFPTAVVNENEEHFTFVLTDLDSKYRFGFCLYRPKGDTCMCFISDLPWYKVFYRALDKISEFKLAMQNELVEPLLSGLYSHPLPSAGDESLSVQSSGTSDAPSYSFPLPSSPSRRLPEIPTDHNLTYFYTNIHYNVLLHLFANMIFERRIIITSSSLSLLSASVHGAVMLLYPLHWQHIYIPIMPQHLKDYCGAPMPFLMGVHSSLMENVRRMPMDDVVILDMDENVIESPHVDDLGNMPSDVIAELKHVLKKETSSFGDNACKAFMLAMVSMIGGYRKALKFREGETEVMFDEEAFFTSRPQMEEFLASLLHFQHFRQFINSRIDQLKNRSVNRDLFDIEAMFYDEEMKGTTQEKMKTAFNKFVSSTRDGGKRLLEKSHQLQKASKKYWDIVDKKAFQKFVKDTRRISGRDRIEDSSEDNGPFSEKSYIFPPPPTPDMGLSRSSSTLSTFSTPGLTPAMLIAQAAKRPPPRVIPYHQHQEGKKKLAELLKEQNKRTSASSLDQAAIAKTLGSPESTHSSLQPPDDHAEKASLDSRGSTEASASVSSGEVATATLIDITADERSTAVAGSEAVGESKEEEVLQQRERASTGSDSMVSTASSSSEELPATATASRKAGQRRGWVNFDEEDSHQPPPPLPPPRSELDNYSSCGAVLANPLVETTEDVIDFNPFSRTEPAGGAADGRVSPFEDFSAQIAQTLLDQSRNRSSIDSYTANLIASASRDLYRTIGTQPQPIPEQRESGASLPEPLIPTSSSTSISSLDRGSCAGAIPSTNPFAPVPLLSVANGFPSHPLAHREWVRPKGPPPPKPKPYSGKPVSELQSAIRADDPFGNLLEGMSLQAYANSSSSSGVNKCGVPGGQLASTTQQTSVESPLV